MFCSTSKRVNDIRVNKLFWVNKTMIIAINSINRYNNVHIFDTNENGLFIDYEIGKRMFPKAIFIDRKRLYSYGRNDHGIIMQLSDIEHLYHQQHVKHIRSVSSFFLN